MCNASHVLCVLALLGTPGISSAQSTSILPADAEAGDRLTVRTTTGQAFSGRLTSDSGGALVLRSRTGEQRIDHAEVAQVNRHRNRILFGPLIGLAAGIAAGVPVKALADNETGDGNREMVKMVALGVGVGTVIDLFTRSTTTIYRKGGPASGGLVLQPRKAGGALWWRASW